MKILIKYIAKLSLNPILVGLAGFVIFAAVEILYQLSDLIVRHRVSILILFKVLYYYLPYFVSMGIPVGVLLAIFWILTQLANDHELMALQVHGVSPRVLIVPFLIIAAGLSGVTYLLSDRVVPIYNQKASQALSKYVYRQPEVFISENVVAKIDESQYFYVKRYDKREGTLHDVILFKNESGEEEIITANRVVREGNTWYMYDGRLYRVDSEGLLKFDVKFNRVELNLKEDLETLMRIGKSPKDMRSEELKSRINTFVKLGVDPAPWVVELHTRYSLSLGPVIIVLAGIPLSLIFNLKSKSWGVILTFVIVVLYQGSGAWLSAMGKERLLDPVLAAWIPDISFACTGIFLYILLDTPAAYKIREFLVKFLLVTVLVLCTTSFAFDSIQISAERVFYTESAVTFCGNVTAFYKEAEINASTMTVFLTEDGKAHEAECLGSVNYRKEDVSIESQNLRFSFQESVAVMMQIRGKTVYEDEKGKKHLMYFSAEELTSNNQISEMKLGYITTCELEKPHYRLQALNVELKENEYLVAYDVVMYIFEAPTIYFPIYFVSLKDEPQPFSFMVGYSKEKGMTFETEYNMTFEDGSVSALIGYSQDGTTYTDLKLAKHWNDLKATLNYERETSNDQKNTYNIVGELDNIPLPIPSKLRVNFDDEKTGFLLEGSLEKNLRYQILRTVDPPSIHWTLPYVEVRKLTLSSTPMLFVVDSFSHRTVARYDEGNLFEHFDDMDTSGRFRSHASASMPEPFTSLRVDILNSYRFNGRFLTDNPGENYAVLDMNLASARPKIDWGWAELNANNNILTGIWLSPQQDLSYRLADAFSLSVKFKPLKVMNFSVGYSRTEAFWVGTYSRFSNNKDSARINLSASLSVPTTIFGFSTHYDILENEWSKLNLTSDTKISIYDTSFLAKTRTIYDTKAQNFESTSFDIRFLWLSLSHKTQFTWKYNQERPVDFISNTLQIKGKDFFFMRTPSVKIVYKLSVEPFDLLSLEAKGTFKIEKSSHQFSALYLKNSSRLNFSYKATGLDPNFSVSLSMKTDPLLVNRLEIGLEKNLHCWGMKLESSFKADPAFSVEKLSFKFYINEFPNKSFSFDPVQGEMDISVF